MNLNVKKLIWRRDLMGGWIVCTTHGTCAIVSHYRYAIDDAIDTIKKQIALRNTDEVSLKQQEPETVESKA